ncbi:sodium- and chloride-dependent neutral and basic amino acid transporter B(0+)-like [Mugil cephalus]|uniref:sodium- and chloride-dependent neutral and basic amino acid transporter B(0+)-like n=1 Tax=Mugil cephalus TaxID=48193 RepID=UPI001FB582FE|nr:sodium- and chloride-dependent neutral and basic amino acid transporter B(0+)-like [Mugil cephalus]
MPNCDSKSPKDPPAGQESLVDGAVKSERGNWTNKTEYILTMTAYAVGLGNIWRFPYLAYRNGGAAFLIPYFLTLFLCGIPLYFMESAVGQFCSQGPLNMWRAVPILQGVGIGIITLNAITAIYYNVIIAYSLFYLFASMQSTLPWSSCSSWADSHCSSTPIVYCNVSGILMTNWTQENQTCPSSDMITVPVQSPSEQYWDRVALQRSSGLDETGSIVWHLALCLLLSSTLVASVLMYGIKISGKVVYFTATFPFLVILILLIRGVTLEGAEEGIAFYIGSKSNFTKLTEAQIWTDAASQTFYSLSIAWGGVVTLSSYNNFHNQMVLWDSVALSFINHGTSVFAGFAIFSVLGHMAHNSGKPVDEVVDDGFALAFIAYPEALATLPVAPVWSVLFFLMLLIVGLDSQFTFIEVIMTTLMDSFPVFKSKRPLLCIGVCIIVFLLGLPCVTAAGIYWVTLIDHYCSTFVALILAFLEIVGFCYIYGINRLIKDIEMMIEKQSFYFWLWWKASWLVITPFIILGIFVWSMVTYTDPTYADIEYPSWGLALGWCMIAFVLVWIPVVAVYKITKAEGNLWKRFLLLCNPSEKWHPYLEINRGERYSEEKCCQKIILTDNKKMGS